MSKKKVFGTLAVTYGIFMLITVISLSTDMKKNNGAAFAMGKNSSQSFDIDELKTAAFSQSSDLTIEGVMEEITIKFENRTDVSAHFYGNIRISGNKPEMIVEESGSKIKITIKYSRTNSNSFSKLKLDVLVPQSFSNNLEISSVSGDITTINDTLKIKNLSIENVSGDSSIKNFNCDDFSAENISGDIDIENVTALKTNFNSVSGDIKANNFKSNTNAISVSGSILLSILSLDAEYKLETVSGDIELFTPAGSEFVLKANTVSGEIESPDFALKIDKKTKRSMNGKTSNGTFELNMETVSGDISVKSK